MAALQQEGGGRKKPKKKKKRPSVKKPAAGAHMQPSETHGGILKDRVKAGPSFTEFVCDGSGEDNAEHVKQTRKTQDGKYVAKKHY